jgi:type IV pilus assembly protein PilB
MYGTKRLGEWLIERGKITPQQLQEALEAQKLTGKRLGEILIEQGYITPEDYYEVQAAQYEVPYEPLLPETLAHDPTLRLLIPASIAMRHFLFPLRKEGNTLHLAMADPNNVEAQDYIRQLTGLNLKLYYAPPERILHAIAQHYGVPDEMVTAAHEEAEESLDEPLNVHETANQPPIIRLVNTILFEAIEQRASDIHLEPQEQRLQVRYRIDGVLYPVRAIPRALQAAVLARLKLMAEMDIAERRRPQDGRFTFRVGERKIDARVSTLPTAFGERIVVRLLDREHALLQLEQLGMPDALCQRLQELAARPWGMILVTGPTGAGKTTTLYALLQHLRSDRRNILTCEDPIEYTLPGIGQSQVNERAGLTFAQQLRAILRQDPDVVLVGEIRDSETAEIACRAAMTGHLVLATLHTNDATSAPARLLDMGIPPFLINSALTGVLAQRLVRRLCIRCREPVQVKASALPIDPAAWGDCKQRTLTLYEPRGCTECNQIGYRGRIGVYELLVVSESTRHLIAQRADSNALRAACSPDTLFPLWEDARQKVLQGITSLEEALALVNDLTTCSAATMKVAV